jgi:hypothetical protein
MQRISGILRNHGHVFKEGKSTWTKKHRAWLAPICQKILEGSFKTTLAIELQHLEYLKTEQTAMDAELDRYASLPQFRTTVEALCGLRGVKNSYSSYALSRDRRCAMFQIPALTYDLLRFRPFRVLFRKPGVPPLHY